MSSRVVRIEAAAVVDARGVESAPGALLLRASRGDQPSDPPRRLEVLAAGAVGGSPGAGAGVGVGMDAHPEAAGAAILRLPDAVLAPALVNAHTHLDLTHIGPRPFDPASGFTGWARMILAGRRTEEAAVRESVRMGVERSLAGGVMAVGDIAGIESLAALEALRDSALAGVSYLEFFGIGERQEEAAGRMRAALARAAAGDAGSRIRAGLQPHATYSAGLRLYAAAADEHNRSGAPLCTHLGELAEERRFIARGDGPMRDFLEELGAWGHASMAEVGHGRTPVAHMAGVLACAPFLLAHVNDATNEDLEVLARTRATVAYCPRCHEYFRHPEDLGPHRYREMLDRGVNVALGTDSIVNLPEGAGSERITPLDDARLLFRRDGFPPRRLLEMITTAGARALGLPEEEFLFTPGPLLGVAAIEVSRASAGRSPAERIMAETGGVRLLRSRDLFL